MRLSYSSRFFLYAPLCLFLGLAIWVMTHWWLAAGAFDKKLQAMKGHEALPGITLDWSKVAISGFPFRIDAVFDDLRVSGAGAHGPFAWDSENFALHALTYGRIQTVYEAQGRQRLSWTGGDGAAHAIDFMPGALQASSVGDGRGLARFDMHVLSARGPDVSAADVQLHFRRDPDHKSLDLMLSADGVTLKNPSALLGRKIARLRLYQTLTDGAAFAPLLNGTSSWAATARNWRGAALVTDADVKSEKLTSRARDPRLAGILSPLY